MFTYFVDSFSPPDAANLDAFNRGVAKLSLEFSRRKARCMPTRPMAPHVSAEVNHFLSNVIASARTLALEKLEQAEDVAAATVRISDALHSRHNLRQARKVIDGELPFAEFRKLVKNVTHREIVRQQYPAETIELFEISLHELIFEHACNIKKLGDALAHVVTDATVQNLRRSQSEKWVQMEKRQLTSGRSELANEIKTYALAAANNRIKRQRGQGEHLPLPETKDGVPFDPPDEFQNPKELVSAKELAGIVKQCMDDLKPPCRKLLLWRLVEMRPVKEVAKELEKTAGWVKTNTLRCKKNFESKLQQRGITDGY